MTTKRLSQRLALIMMRQKGRITLAVFAGLCLYSMLRGSPLRSHVTERIAEVPQMPQVPVTPVTVLPQESERKTGYTALVNNFRYSHRRGLIIDQCLAKHGPDWTSSLKGLPNFPSQPVISTKRNFMYCPVGKVGSSFFTRYAISAVQPTMQSPYKISIFKAARSRCENLGQLGAGQGAFLNKAVKVVFGRNPFSRIFSAFIDKLFSPNPYYWKNWGGSACASELTFTQFVGVVVEKLVKTDVHLRPVFEECRMCDVMYDIVGTLETTGADLVEWSKAINVSDAFLQEESYRIEAAMDTVIDSVESPFSWKKDIKKCMDLDQMGMRIWRKLQIRGVIDSRISYPFKDGEIDAMSSTTFIAACRKAIDSSNDKAQLKKQKTQAFVEAYSSISLEKISAIASVYKDDFTAFNYDPVPPKLISERTSVEDTDFINWRIDWQL